MFARHKDSEGPDWTYSIKLDGYGLEVVRTARDSSTKVPPKRLLASQKKHAAI